MSTVPMSEPTGSVITYLRVSTLQHGQSLEMQRHALARLNPVREFSDEGVSGARMDRPGLAQALDYLRPGDTLAVYSLSRLGRSVRGTLDLVDLITNEKQAYLHSATEALDTATPFGRAMLVCLMALQEMEREVLAERVSDGLASARAQGRVGGRPRALSDEQVSLAKTLYASRQHTVKSIAATLGCSRATVYRVLTPAG